MRTFTLLLMFGCGAEISSPTGDESALAGPVCASVSESSTATITCPAGQTIAGIDFASYGLPTGSCGSFAAGTCNAATSLSVVKAACLGKHSCSVAANNTTFGDPCRGADKFLDIQATCTTPPLCGSAAEGSSLTLTCPSGQVITQVTFASYGLPTGACGGFAKGACDATTSMSVVQGACVGKNSCTVSANNTTFGDPCRGADKTLDVQVVCGTSGGGTTTTTGGTSGGTTTGGTSGSGGYFPSSAVWYQDVSAAALDSESSTVTSWLNGAGWGTGTMQIDFSIEVLHADSTVTPRAFTKTGDWFSPDCDSDPVPVPPGGALEGETGYACTGDGDCHLIVTQGTKLYEMWRANITSAGFMGGCLAVWNMTRVYTPSGRGDGCTSADAAGYPIAPLLFTADEVAAGHIDHAIRFILPNARIRKGVYLHPATHSTGAASGPAGAPPYGTRLRLRPDYPLSSLPNDAARTVARAMQKYGMFLADGGNIALTAQSDRVTQHKWSGLLGARDLSAIKPGDFQMVNGGTRLDANSDCVRTPE